MLAQGPIARVGRYLRRIGTTQQSRHAWRGSVEPPPARRPRGSSRNSRGRGRGTSLRCSALIAVVALLPLPGPNPQDISRACLAEALLHGHVSNDSCLAVSRDYAVRDGHRYSDKAPGLSVLELPAVAALRPLPFGGGANHRLWAMRAVTIGLALLACAFLVGRVSEGIAPGYGAITMVTFALGTMAASLAADQLRAPAGGARRVRRCSCSPGAGGRSRPGSSAAPPCCSSTRAG